MSEVREVQTLDEVLTLAESMAQSLYEQCLSQIETAKQRGRRFVCLKKRLWCERVDGRHGPVSALLMIEAAADARAKELLMLDGYQVIIQQHAKARAWYRSGPPRPSEIFREDAVLVSW